MFLICWHRAFLLCFYHCSCIPDFLPIMFLRGEDIISGMPSFFVFAVIFTVFMLDGGKMLLFAGLELAVYVGCCAAAYLIPDSITLPETEKILLMDVTIGMLNLASMRENIEKRVTDYTTLLKSCVKTWHITVRRQRNKLHTDIPDNLSKVFRNADLVAQVMSNLLQNSNTYTYNGEIRIIARENNNKIKVTVKDDGTGIPAELLPHVFERGVSGAGGDQSFL